MPDNIVSISKHDFSPRVGFAYNPHLGTKHLVVRGGYGMYYFPIPARTFSELRLNPPMQGTLPVELERCGLHRGRLAQRALRYAPDVITGVNSANAIRIAPPSPGIQMTALNPDLPTARAHQYNFTIEHEVIKDTVVRAGFIGTAGRNLEMMELFNRNPVSNYVWYANTGLAAAHRHLRQYRAPRLRPDRPSATSASTASSDIRTSPAFNSKPSGASARAWRSSSSTC